MDLKINDEQTTELLASPLLHRSEKQVETDHKVITLKENTSYPTRPDLNPARGNLLLWSTLNRREKPPRFLKKRDSSFSQEAYAEILKRERQVERA